MIFRFDLLSNMLVEIVDADEITEEEQCNDKSFLRSFSQSSDECDKDQEHPDIEMMKSHAGSSRCGKQNRA